MQQRFRNAHPNQVNHPHVVELLGAGFTSEGRRFLLLEHLPEGTLGTFHALSAREEMRGLSTYRYVVGRGHPLLPFAFCTTDLIAV